MAPQKTAARARREAPGAGAGGLAAAPRVGDVAVARYHRIHARPRDSCRSGYPEVSEDGPSPFVAEKEPSACQVPRRGSGPEMFIQFLINQPHKGPLLIGQVRRVVIVAQLVAPETDLLIPGEAVKCRLTIRIRQFAQCLQRGRKPPRIGLGPAFSHHASGSEPRSDRDPRDAARAAGTTSPGTNQLATRIGASSLSIAGADVVAMPSRPDSNRTVAVSAQRTRNLVPQFAGRILTFHMPRPKSQVTGCLPACCVSVKACACELGLVRGQAEPCFGLAKPRRDRYRVDDQSAGA